MTQPTGCWKFIFYVGKDRRIRQLGWFVFSLGLVCLIDNPRPGEIVRRENYKSGYRIGFRFWLPIDKF